MNHQVLTAWIVSGYFLNYFVSTLMEETYLFASLDLCWRCRWKFFEYGIWQAVVIPDPGSASKNLSILSQKNFSNLSEIWSVLFIPDPDPDFFTHPGSRIQGSKRHRVPDPDPQRWWQGKVKWRHLPQNQTVENSNSYVLQDKVYSKITYILG